MTRDCSISLKNKEFLNLHKSWNKEREEGQKVKGMKKGLRVSVLLNDHNLHCQ